MQKPSLTEGVGPTKCMCHCGAQFKFLVLSFMQRLVSWDNLLILDPQRHIHKRSVAMPHSILKTRFNECRSAYCVLDRTGSIIFIDALSRLDYE